ncbi:MAG: hypothetical protein QM658_15560 [Gordonia sp. (in: high G+C Gram-positive bacteria)]
MNALDSIPAHTVVPPLLSALLHDVVLTPNGASPSGTARFPKAGISCLLGASLPKGVAVDYTLRTLPDFALDFDLPGVTVTAPSVVRGGTGKPGGSATSPRTVVTPSAAPLTFTATGSLKVTVSAGSARLSALSLTLKASSDYLVLPGDFALHVPRPITIHDDHIDFGNTALVLPPTLPFLGGLALPVSISGDLSGLSVDATVDGPAIGLTGITATIGWRVPGPMSLADLVPTSLEVAYTTTPGTVPGGPVSDRPLTLRLTGSRPPDEPGAFSMSLSAEATSAGGILSAGPSNDPAAVAAGIATVLAVGVAALPSAQSGLTLAAALAGGAGLAGMASKGGVTLDRMALDADTRAGGSASLSVDVTGAVHPKRFTAGPVEISVDDDRPMKVRWRDVRVTVPLESGTPAIDLSHARPEVVDAGGWRVKSPGSLLDVVGTRSGSGSTWIEVDLVFALDLGPIKVSGATIRATYQNGGLDVGLRGLDASINLPGLITGEGKVALRAGEGDAQGLDLTLAATVVPLNLGALAVFSSHVSNGVRQTLLAVGVDLPGPLPLGPSGLGLYGVLGAFGSNAAMTPLGDDPLTGLRKWKPWDPEQFDVARGQTTLGLGVIIGTVPDDGFTFSSRGVLGMTAPDLALRIGLDATVMSPRYRFANIQQTGTGDGPSMFGGLSADSNALDVGLAASYHLPYLLDLKIPVAGHFPSEQPQRWWFHAGSDDGVDGYHPATPRPPGPLQATVFPQTPLATSGWAFLMVRGDGLDQLMHSGGPSFDGFTVAVGAGFSKTFGVEGVLWAKANAGVCAAISADPLLFWANAHVGGELGLGPFSLGLDADLTLEVGPGTRLGYHLRMCGEVDLWLTTLRGCIQLSNTAAAPVIEDPDPSKWPWPRVRLADGMGRSLATAADLTAGHNTKDAPLQTEVAAPTPHEWSTAPTAWPDTIPLLTFPIAPKCLSSDLNNSALSNTGLTSSGRISYEWQLVSVVLERCDVDPPEPVVGVRTWQPPAEVSSTAASTSTLRQLALLSPSTTTSTAHYDDADDLTIPERVGRLCALRPTPGRGWALGRDATRARKDWHVPRERDLGSPRVIQSFSGGTGFTVSTSLDQAAELPGVGIAEGPCRIARTVADGRELDDALQLRGYAELPFLGEFSAVFRYTVKFDEPIAEGTLFVQVTKCRGGDEALYGRGVHYTIHRKSRDESDSVSMDDGVWIAPIEVTDTGDPALAISLTCAAGFSIAVVGLHAMTEADRDAADAAGKKAAATAAAEVTGDRTVLAAGARYRISARMSFARTVTDAQTQQPTVTQGPEETRYWYFQTARETSIPSPVLWKKSAAIDVLAAASTINTFDASYLNRYLREYRPGDRTDHWFTDDLPSAVFRVDHLDKLLGAYGRETAVMARRTDRPRSSATVSHTVAPVRIYSAGTPFEAKAAAAADEAHCDRRPTGSQVTWPKKLAPNAKYELTVAFPKSGKPATDASPQLDGISFGTSRYANPSRLLNAMGFVSSGTTSTAAVHDLRVIVPAPGVRNAGRRRGDASLESALDALELPPPAPVEEPVTAVLWVFAGASWRIAGVLLASPEPLIRDDRMDLGPLTAAGSTSTAQYIGDAGTRVLWLFPNPIAVAGKSGSIRVDLADRKVAKPRRLRTSALPAFAAGAFATGSI